MARAAQGSAGSVAAQFRRGCFGGSRQTASGSCAGNFAVRNFDRTFDLGRSGFYTGGSRVCGSGAVGGGSAELGCCERGGIGGNARGFSRRDFLFHADAREGN